MPPLLARRRVEFRDTDAAGIAHFSAFFVWMESAEHELMRAAGIPVVDHDADGATVSWPRVAASCDYTTAVRFGDEIVVAVSVEAIGRTSVTYGFAFSHAGKAVALGRIVAVRCRMHPGERPEPIPLPPTITGSLEAFTTGSSGQDG